MQDGVGIQWRGSEDDRALRSNVWLRNKGLVACCCPVLARNCQLLVPRKSSMTYIPRLFGMQLWDCVAITWRWRNSFPCGLTALNVANIPVNLHVSGFFFGHLIVLHRWAPNILGGTTTFQNSTWTGQRSFRRWAKDKTGISLKLSVLNLSKFDESTIIDGSILKSKRTVFRITKDGVLYFLLRTSSFKQSNPFKAHVAPPTPSIHLAMSISGMSLQTLGQAEAPVALDSEDAKRCVAKELGLGDKSLVTS